MNLSLVCPYSMDVNSRAKPPAMQSYLFVRKRKHTRARARERRE